MRIELVVSNGYGFTSKVSEIKQITKDPEGLFDHFKRHTHRDRKFYYRYGYKFIITGAEKEDPEFYSKLRAFIKKVSEQTPLSTDGKLTGYEFLIESKAK